MQIEVGVPGLLRDCTEGQSRVVVEAESLAAALERVFSSYPLLRLHVFDDSGKRRRHVLIYFNQENIDWLDDLNVALKPGDRLDILQAVSGG